MEQRYKDLTEKMVKHLMLSGHQFMQEHLNDKEEVEKVYALVVSGFLSGMINSLLHIAPDKDERKGVQKFGDKIMDFMSSLDITDNIQVEKSWK